MAQQSADDTQPSVRSLGGWLCPRCRTPVEGAGGPGAVLRCPADGLALVPAESFAEADGDPFLGTTVAGRFVILGRLGAGSMGTVYRARQEAMGRDIALKILRSDRAFDAQAKARFTREARAMSLLGSPHTVTVFDFGEIPDDHADELGGGTSLYLAMELLEGESLGQRLKRVRRIPVPAAARIARHTLLSLAEAHDKGVIHRDLKPDNLFLTRLAGGDESEEICKVLDFGIAKVASSAVNPVDQLETQAGTVFGTPRYMSPEQAQGRTLDARSDLYSLGVLLYQMLVGRAPFVDDDAVVVMARHIKSLPVPPGEAVPEAAIPPAVSALVMRALAKDPNDRPPSARQFIAELERAAGGAAAAVRGPTAELAAAGATGDVPVVRDDLDTAPPPRPRRAPVSARSLRSRPSPWSPPASARSSSGLAPRATRPTAGPPRRPSRPRRPRARSPTPRSQRRPSPPSASAVPVAPSSAALPAITTAPSAPPVPTTAPVATVAPAAAPATPLPRRPAAPHKGYTRFE